MARSAKAIPKMKAAQRTALLELAAELGDKSLVADVALAADDQLAYLEKFAEPMADISVDAPRSDLAWLALISGLSTRDILLELDWRHPAYDALLQIRRLASVAGKKALKKVPDADDEDEMDERPIEEALELFGKALDAAKQAIISFDKSSDSYPIAVVAKTAVPRLVKLAKASRGRIVHHSGAGLAAFEATRAKAAQKQAKRAASNDPWIAMVDSTWQKTSEGVLWKLRGGSYSAAEIRAAMSHAPARDRALIAMTLAFYDTLPAAKLARATDDPALALRALNFLGGSREPERLAAAAILAERLQLVPGKKPTKQALQIAEACNLFSSDRANDEALAKLPAKHRTFLARLVDSSFIARGSAPAPIRAFRVVGDASTLAILASFRAELAREYPHLTYFENVDIPISRIEKRIAASRR